MNFQDADLLLRIAEIANPLGSEGQEFNRHLIEQFKDWNRVSTKGLTGSELISNEHMLFYKAVAQALRWLQQITTLSEDGSNKLDRNLSSVIYLQVLVEIKTGLVKETGRRLLELLDQSRSETNAKKPRRLLAVIAGLETWSRVDLPKVGSHGVLNLEEVQHLALSACGRARWTALAPLKMYAIYKLYENRHSPISRELFPPMGKAVSRGIERLLGFTLGESGSDYSISRGLHLKLADLSNSSIWDINSGFYRLGGGI